MPDGSTATEAGPDPAAIVPVDVKVPVVVSTLYVETSFEPLYEGQLLFDGIQEIMRELGFGYRGNFGQLASPEDGRVLQCDAIFVRVE